MIWQHTACKRALKDFRLFFVKDRQAYPAHHELESNFIVITIVVVTGKPKTAMLLCKLQPNTCKYDQSLRAIAFRAFAPT